MQAEKLITRLESGTVEMEYLTEFMLHSSRFLKSIVLQHALVVPDGEHVVLECLFTGNGESDNVESTVGLRCAVLNHINGISDALFKNPQSRSMKLQPLSQAVIAHSFAMVSKLFNEIHRVKGFVNNRVGGWNLGFDISISC